MNFRILVVIVISCALAAQPSTSPAKESTQEHAVMSLVKEGAPACRLVVASNSKTKDLLDRSVKLVADIVERWSGAKLSISTLGGAKSKLPDDAAMVFVTFEVLQQIAPDLASDKEFARAAEIDDQGFVFVPHVNTLQTDKIAKQLFVVSKSARGIYNGAVYLRDFCIDGDKTNLMLDTEPLTRDPLFRARPVYNLTIWGDEAKYTTDDWAKVFASFSRDGVDRVYFWVSGHFPSKKYPQTYNRAYTFADTTIVDTTKDSRIGSIEELKKVIDNAHKVGLRIYLGGAFGGWVGSMFLTDLDPVTLKVGPKEPSLCPSNKKAHAAMLNYYVEMFNALPEADGLFIESTDEFGECQCVECSRKLDELGSKQFGQAQLDLCEEIMKEIWQKHPHARFAYTIGYAEHKSDVLYYQRIKQMSKDPRYEWMEARKSWSFPGPKGEARKATYFSNQIMHWSQMYAKPLNQILIDANRAKQEKFNGLIMSFEPGYATGSFYTEIPFPTDILPHVLTLFVYREATWGAASTEEQMKERAGARFFGKNASKGLVDDLWSLREMIRTRKDLKQLDAIEQHVKEASVNATPKTAEGLKLMARAVNDIRNFRKRK